MFMPTCIKIPEVQKMCNRITQTKVMGNLKYSINKTTILKKKTLKYGYNPIDRGTRTCHQ